MSRSIGIGWLFWASSAIAQVWCPNGAVWHHGLNMISGQGHIREEYVGDTLIDGVVAQKISATGAIWDPGLSTYVPISEPLIHTRSGGDVVFVRYEEQFDTLFNFAAVPGDRWSMPGSVSNEICTDTSGFTVMDTGHVMVSGYALRWLAVQVQLSSSYTYADTLVERMGGMHVTWFWPWIACWMDYGGHGPLRCYSDEDISYGAPDWPFGCDSFDAIPVVAAPPTLVLFPDPGSDQVFIQGIGQGDPMSIEFRDVTGRLLSYAVVGHPGPIDVSRLTLGTYTYRVLDAHGTSLVSGRWVKQ